MEAVTVEALRQRAVPYEKWRAPLDPALRQVAMLSGPTMGLGGLLAVAWPLLLELSRSGFFLVLSALGAELAWGLGALSPLILSLNVTGLVGYGLLMAITRSLRTGKRWCHWAAMAAAVLGAANAALITLWLALVVVNLAIWAAGLVLLGVAMVVGLPIMALMFLGGLSR